MAFSLVSSTGLLICGAVAVSYAIAITVYSAFFHPLAKIPGPKIHAISSLPYINKLISGQWAFTLRQLHDRYGPVVRITPSDVSFITVEAWKDIYGHKFGGEPHFNKDKRLYRGSLSSAENILVADDAQHARMRRLLAHAFSEKALRAQEDIVKHYIDLLIVELRTKCAEGQPVDMVKWYNFTTFDIIGDLAFGEPFGCLENGGYHPWVAMIFGGFKLSCYSQSAKRVPILAPFFRWKNPTQLLKNSTQHFQLSHQKARKRVESGRTDREDFVSYILRHNDEKGMTSDEIGENANVLIVAGSETTSTLLSGTTFWLLKRPESYRKLVQEIRSTFEKEEDINMISVANLKYLLAVFNEGLRIYPPVPSGLGRQTPQGGKTINGYWIPQETIVSVPHWAAYHSAENFKDPDNFCPERWQDDSRFRDDNKEILQPFSFGPRNCLGKNLAYTEMRLILTRLLWNFDLELMSDSQSWNEQKVFLFWEKGPLNIKLTPGVKS